MTKLTIAIAASTLAVLASLASAQAGPRPLPQDGVYQVASWWTPPRPPRAAVAAVRG